MLRKHLKASIQGAVLGIWAAGLIWWEYKRSLRPVIDSKVKRDTRNLAVASLAGAATQFLEVPVALAVAQRSTGLLRILPIPAWLQPLAGVLLLDYTLYIWHRMTHQLPFLWRFHRVHHLDREMDASTALRFHFGEITLSVAFRSAQIWVIGPSPEVYLAWQTFLILCILFHHANVRLPIAWERNVARILITPRLHGIHHSIAASEVNSNWSSGLTVWDWLHGTLRTRVPQHPIVIGVPGLRGDRDQELGNVLLLPFTGPAATIPMPERRVSEPVSALMA